LGTHFEDPLGFETEVRDSPRDFSPEQPAMLTRWSAIGRSGRYAIAYYA
jgi:hypothetical protein